MRTTCGMSKTGERKLIQDWWLWAADDDLERVATDVLLDRFRRGFGEVLSNTVAAQAAFLRLTSVSKARAAILRAA